MPDAWLLVSFLLLNAVFAVSVYFYVYPDRFLIIKPLSLSASITLSLLLSLSLSLSLLLSLALSLCLSYSLLLHVDCIPELYVLIMDPNPKASALYPRP